MGAAQPKIGANRLGWPYSGIRPRASPLPPLTASARAGAFQRVCGVLLFFALAGRSRGSRGRNQVCAPHTPAAIASGLIDNRLKGRAGF
jgi:hypothetical protein